MPTAFFLVGSQKNAARSGETRIRKGKEKEKITRGILLSENPLSIHSLTAAVGTVQALTYRYTVYNSNWDDQPQTLVYNLSTTSRHLQYSQLIFVQCHLAYATLALADV